MCCWLHKARQTTALSSPLLLEGAQATGLAGRTQGEILAAGVVLPLCSSRLWEVSLIPKCCNEQLEKHLALAGQGSMAKGHRSSKQQGHVHKHWEGSWEFTPREEKSHCCHSYLHWEQPVRNPKRTEGSQIHVLLCETPKEQRGIKSLSFCVKSQKNRGESAVSFCVKRQKDRGESNPCLFV